MLFRFVIGMIALCTRVDRIFFGQLAAVAGVNLIATSSSDQKLAISK